MKLFDLHCDTLYEAWRQNLSPFHSDRLMVAFNRVPFALHRQVMAIWCDSSLDDSAAYDNFEKILAYAKNREAEESQTPKSGDTPRPSSLPLRTARPEIPPLSDEKNEPACRRVFPILAVEDARLLPHPECLRTLYDKGVRLLTLTWKGHSRYGGSWDTDEGLTKQGAELLRLAGELGVAIDLSHASDRLFFEALPLAEKWGTRLLASHSNSRALCPHPRNLTDEMFRALVRQGGLVGVSIVPHHLAAGRPARFSDVIDHFLHFLSLGGEESLAFGSDFDGVEELPSGVTGIESVPALYDALAAKTSIAVADKVFFENAERFFAPLVSDGQARVFTIQD